MAKLFDSVAPDVKMISFASAPIKSATCKKVNGNVRLGFKIYLLVQFCSIA